MRLRGRLIITADDFGLHPRYDAGIREALAAGALDAVSVMVGRIESAPTELLEAGIALGVHLEEGDPAAQVARFEGLFGRRPEYLDGHHHGHATPTVTALAAHLDLAVRSIDERHRLDLRAAGVRTPDRLIGRYEESQPALPAELASAPTGWTEWMVHPGLAAGDGVSSYDAGREEDLRMLLELELPEGITRSDQRSLPRP